MSVFLLVLLGAAAGLAIGELFSDDDNESSDGEFMGGDDEGEIVRIDTAPGFTGTEGDDVFTFSSEASGSVTTSIDAGAGDDVIDLASLFGNPGLFGSDIQGGAGDDQISVQGDSNTISGGEGDDTIAAVAFSSRISGDAGDDVIRVTNISADVSNVDGGTGNDTIDVTDSDNINVTGGEGDDVLISDGRTLTGTGYAIAIDGGEGDDTLNHSADVFPLPLQSPSENGALLTGGDGSDTFNIALTTGNGSFSSSDEDPPLYLNNAAFLTDFEQGVDVLELDIPTFLAGYSAESATLFEDTADGLTTFSISLTSDSLPDQNFRVTLFATGLTWDDVSFVDQTPSTLLVA